MAAWYQVSQDAELLWGGGRVGVQQAGGDRGSARGWERGETHEGWGGRCYLQVGKGLNNPVAGRGAMRSEHSSPGAGASG